MSNDTNKVKMQLDKLALRNRDSNYVNEDLYRILYKEEMYIMAYETIRVNKGATTLGSSKTGIDGTSMRKIRNIITQLRNESFNPRPCRRTYIPKPNGKQRPLGLPDFEEKLVQQCVTRILECIYDSPYHPTFVEESHGFRKGRSCHSALKQMKNPFSGTKYVIKADVKGFYDNIDHHTLISILRKRIKDERFIRLIWKFLRAGVLIEDDKGMVFIKKKKYKYHKTDIGTPQGGIASSILANIYLHEFDTFVKNLKSKHYIEIKNHPHYQDNGYRLARIKKKLTKLSKNDNEYQELYSMKGELEKYLRTLDSKKTFDVENNLFTVNYVRYADDWIIGIKGTASQANYVFEECKKFFKDTLKLDWNLSKSYMSRSYDKDHEFLGINIHFVSPKQIRYKRIRRKGKVLYKRTVQQNVLKYNCPTELILNKLCNKGYLRKKNGKLVSHHQSKVMNLHEYDIARHYQAVINGIVNYYRFVNNVQALNYIGYLLCESMIKTLAGKYKTTVRKTFKRFGSPPKIWREDKKKSITIQYSPKLKRNILAFSVKEGYINWKSIFFNGIGNTKSYLKQQKCCMCPSTERIEVHHVRHIKRIGEKYKGFHKVLGAINRKQIPVCYKCHSKIHHGKYDGANLKQLAETIRMELGIVKYSTTRTDRHN